MSTSRLHHQAVSLFLALLGLYGLMGGGHIYTPDGVVMYQVSASLLEGKLSFPALPAYAEFGGQPAGEPGQLYSKYGLGMSLVGLPLVALARAVEPLARDEERSVFDTPATVEGLQSWGNPPAQEHDERSFRRLWYGTSAPDFRVAFEAWAFTWVSALAAAGTAVVVMLIAAELGLPALWAGLAAGLATPLLHYAQTAWSEPLATFLFCSALYAALRERQLVAGFLMGCVVLTKPALVVLALPLAALLRPAAVLGALPPLAVIAAYNAARFGVPWSTGYGDETGSFTTSPLVGLGGLLLSPGRGLLPYCPLVLSLVGLRRLPLRPALAIGGSLAVLLALYSTWWQWEGGWCWGPRFLLPALPLLALPAAALGWRGLAVASGLVALNGLLVNPHDYYQWMKALGQVHWSRTMWTLDRSPLLTWWTFPVKETMLLPAAVLRPGLVLAILGLFGTCGVAGVLGLLRFREGDPPSAA